MLRLAGPPAFSPFRLDKHLAALRRVRADVQGLQARYVFFVDVAHTLEPAALDRLHHLLGATGAPGDSPGLLVVPRLGTISPWSTKATDILHRCELTAVRRVERGVAYAVEGPAGVLNGDETLPLAPALHDPMTESALPDGAGVEALFRRAEPAPLRRIPVGTAGRAALLDADERMGLALAPAEIDYLVGYFKHAGRDPTDVELMMFAQANSEHCRHKIFNAAWTVDGVECPESLIGLIKTTAARSPEGVLSAYRDNAAVVAGRATERFLPGPPGGGYAWHREPAHLVMKAETHNHPTAIAPFPGAATGSGGEIRDEGATGRGARPKLGLTGFAVSHLRIPDFEQPWERDDPGRPGRIASPLDIMLDGPLGAAAFNNEFGRPTLGGYFRTFEQRLETPDGGEYRGYHKPIMLAGGLGSIRPAHVAKGAIPVGARIVVLGGPAMLIGLGGGAASSVSSGASDETLDFASVQRGNPEMQRRCQEVIDHCCALGDANPIISIHDVGAGGLANAVPELLHDAGRGGRVELRAIPNDDPGMTPLEVWCNEAQERYVLAAAADAVARLEGICERERCPWAVIGDVTGDGRLLVWDSHFDTAAVDISLELLFGSTPRLERDVVTRRLPLSDAAPWSRAAWPALAYRVLRLPAVAAKTFLITIGDRTVGGLSVRDPLVGPWQTPVADVAVTAGGFRGYSGEAAAVGERAPVALRDAPASGRLAVAEAITNLAAAPVARLSDIRLSANWMAACGHPGEDAALRATVEAVARDLCPELGIAIPVGKDSLSMQTTWFDHGEHRSVTAPLSLVVTAFAPVDDVRATLTPELVRDHGETDLWLLDLGNGRDRLGGSALAQAFSTAGGVPPDLDDPVALRAFFDIVQHLKGERLMLAYHDRGDGGLWATLCEMAFAGHCGVECELDHLGGDPVAALFAEELGAVVQTPADRRTRVEAILRDTGAGVRARYIGRPARDGHITVRYGTSVLLSESRVDLERAWYETSYRLQALRDNPECARQAFDALLDADDPGLTARVNFAMEPEPGAPAVMAHRPRVAVLREQGVNGHVEMAAAFERAGFEAVDVHMNDLRAGGRGLDGFQGLAAGGGFSYGDVLGAGTGWARSILYDGRLRDQLATFLASTDHFALGVCNGCQMLAQLTELIPGAEPWPRFERNASEQFEGRLALVEIVPSPSLFFDGMAGSLLPVAVAHGEGRAAFGDGADGAERLLHSGLVPMRYVDHRGEPAETYPANPNGSPAGITGATTPDGRVTILMPHPERVFRTVQLSWHPRGWGDDSPWIRMFRNARAWVG